MAAAQPVTLRRALGFRDLLLYGIVLVQPTAPMPSFGVMYTVARGHVVTVILLALVAMLFTAISYGHMARMYPVGGSAFLYVGKELHPSLGYLTGWCMAMDYILNPLICTIWCAKAAEAFLPSVPYLAWAVGFAVLFTLLNLRGIETSARINASIAAALSVVIVLFITAAAHSLLLARHTELAFYTRPFFDRSSFSSSAVFRGTSIAVLTYIGFDGISTLADEARDPKRNIPRAIVATCLLTGALAVVEVYLGQLLWPHLRPFADVDTAFVQVAGIAGGHWLFLVVDLTLLIANMGSGVASQMGAARLLLSMGQDGALPRSFFGAIESKRQIPQKNVLLIGAICLAGALCFSYQLGTELLNYGALLAFMGVNLSSARLGWRTWREKHQFWAMGSSLLGFTVCLFLWTHLGTLARIAGTAWALLGVALYVQRRIQRGPQRAFQA